MKALHIAAIFFLATAGLWAQVEPAGSKLPRWAAEVQQEKPYVLELAYANTSITLPRLDPKGGADSALSVTDSFLKEAMRIRIGVSSTEAGTFEAADGRQIIYRLQRTGTGFALQIFWQTRGGDTRTINTRLVLSETQWAVIGGGPAESMGGNTMRFYVAVRIDARA